MPTTSDQGPSGLYAIASKSPCGADPFRQALGGLKPINVRKAGLGHKSRAADVNAVIKEVTKDSVIILGFSDGGYTGYYLAASYPDKVKKLVAIGAGVWDKGFRNFNNSREVLINMDSLYFSQQLALMPEPQKWDQQLERLIEYYNSVHVGREIFGAIKCP
ncbi:MAG: alpha/beta hydrolase [Moraxellaceae bacterium]|nr:MAG: alpha/beta hydrolase [Moraxellaceae bacterium]